MLKEKMIKLGVLLLNFRQINPKFSDFIPLISIQMHATEQIILEDQKKSHQFYEDWLKDRDGAFIIETLSIYVIIYENEAEY